MSKREDFWNTDAKIRSDERIAANMQLTKFYMFFAGLVFATVSFIGTNTIDTKFKFIKISEVVSLSCLLLSGVLLLIRLRGLKFSEESCKDKYFWRVIRDFFFNVVFNQDIYYWILFILGMALMIFNRSFMLFV